MANDSKWRGYLVVLGGVLVHLTLGTVYTFGNLTPYLTSYIRVHGSPSDLRYGTSVWIFALSGMGQGFSMFFGGLINRRLGPRLTTLLGSMIMSGGVLLTYLTIQHSFIAVVFTYGLMFGLGVGIAYPIPMASAMRWMPKRKGLVSGCVVAGFGGGAFIFDQIQTAYINHGNQAADQHVGEEVYFTQPEILDKVPNMFLVLGGCYVAMQIVGSLLVIDPPEKEVEYNYDSSKEDDNQQSVEVAVNQENDSEETKSLIPTSRPDDDKETVRQDRESAKIVERGTDEHAVLGPKEVLQQKAFYILWFVFLFNGQGVVFFSSLYKAYGQTFIKDDVFLATVGAFASVFNAGGRIAWGHFADKVSFKVAMMCLCSLFTILMLTIGLTSLVGKPLFAIYVCLIFGTFSGNFSLFPVAISRSFGQLHYPLNYGLLFSSQVITGPIGAVLTSQLKSIIGWYGMFFIVSGFSFSSLILMFVFRVKNAHGKDI